MRTAIDWSIQDVVRMTGTTSRTLRHDDAVGLVAPSRVGDNGHRYSDAAALVRLQHVLMLRELGLGIPAIAEVLTGQRDDVAALRTHLDRAVARAGAPRQAADQRRAHDRPLARRHADWLRTVPGTPRSADGRITREYFAWMAEAYVTDEPLGTDFCGVAAAPFVRDAMQRYAERAL